MADEVTTLQAPARPEPWYADVTRYQWLVLVIASAGWVFDAFEGQLFNLTRQDLLRELVGSDPHRQKFWGDLFLAALLALWVRVSVREPQRWTDAETQGRPMGSLRDLFGTPIWAKRAIFGLLLAAVGLGTFWAVTVAGQDLVREFLIRKGLAQVEAESRAKFAYGFIQATGLGLGLLSFGPLAERLGRRGAFLLVHLCTIAIV